VHYGEVGWRAFPPPRAGPERGKGSGTGTFGSKEKPTLSRHSYGAHFVEVTWQPEIARLRVARAVSVIDAGRILNPLAARNQIEGAVVMGVGMALLEETDYDPRSGAPVNASLADYLVATHADAPRMEVHFVEYPDTSLNELGARGVGEIGLAGTAAAITNAVYHAKGARPSAAPRAADGMRRRKGQFGKPSRLDRARHWLARRPGTLSRGRSAVEQPAADRHVGVHTTLAGHEDLAVLGRCGPGRARRKSG
jgi:Molybdopterin-binding domain of aldehyde dehydrogenase